MKKFAQVTAIAASVLVLGAVAQSANAACKIEGVHPYISNHSGDPRLEAWGTGLNRYWRDPNAYLCGIKSDLDKQWGWGRIRGGEVKIWRDGTWYAKLKLRQETSWLEPNTTCLLTMEQKRSWSSSLKNECDTASMLDYTQWAPLPSVAPYTPLGGDDSTPLAGDADSTVFSFGE